MFGIKPTHDSVLAKMERLASPGYSYCFRCGRPWNRADPHTTTYAEKEGHGAKGCFPLCEHCWSGLMVPEARIEYYKMLVDEWEKHLPVTEEDKRSIQRAVANGG